jgi:hypothetical protein
MLCIGFEAVLQGSSDLEATAAMHTLKIKIFPVLHRTKSHHKSILAHSEDPARLQFQQLLALSTVLAILSCCLICQS